MDKDKKEEKQEDKESLVGKDLGIVADLSKVDQDRDREEQKDEEDDYATKTKRTVG